MNIFVAKLNYDTSSQELKEAFEAYGVVTSANVIQDKMTNRSKGFAFVEMEDEGDAMTAIRALNDTELDGRTIVVKKAEPKKERNDYGRGGW